MIYGLFLAGKYTLFADQYFIKRVVFSTGNIEVYDEPYLYKRIKQWVLKENYYIIKWNKKKILKDISSRYPMVIDMDITYMPIRTIAVELHFRPIDMVIRNQDMLR